MQNRDYRLRHNVMTTEGIFSSRIVEKMPSLVIRMFSPLSLPSSILMRLMASILMRLMAVCC